MCVAIYKPEGIPMPKLEILKQCWEANPDGAGFALLTKGKPHPIEIHKGFMTWEAFAAAFQQHHLADFAGDLLLHFRIATHGGVSPGNTHPFSITPEIKILQQTSVATDVALIHNGILPVAPTVAGISDTMELCRRLAGLHDIPAVLALLEDFIGDNKIAVMTKNKVHLAGKWETLDHVYFSNTFWQHNFFNDGWYDDEPRIPDRFELRLLMQGYCPDCDGEIIRGDDEFYCLECNATFWGDKHGKTLIQKI